MALELVQSTAVTVRIGPFMTSDGTTNAGLTITQASIWVCKNEAAFAVKNDSDPCVAESLASGWYGCPLDDTDTGNPGNLIVYCEYSGVLPVWHNYKVVSAKQSAIYAQLIAQAASLALAAYDGPTAAEQSAALTAIEAQMVAQAASAALTAYNGPTHAEVSAALTAIDAQLKAQAASTALTAYDPPTTAEISAALTALDTLRTAQAASTALAAYDPATPVWAALRASHTTSSSFGALLPSGIQQNKACANITFMMVDSTDHYSPKTGLTVTGTVSHDGGSYGSVTGSIAEISNGTYQFDASAADMNGGKCTFRFTATGADDCFLTLYTTKLVTG